MSKTKIDKFKKYLISRLRQGVSNGKKLLLELKEQGYTNSYASLNRYLKYQLNASTNKRAHSHQKYKRAIRFETEPGEQAQVDWGHFGKIKIKGNWEKLYCFVYILGYSRMMYLEFTTRQNLTVFETCHIHAFKNLGIPRNIVYDNLKTVVIFQEKLPDGSKKVHYNPAFLDFANYYGFTAIASPPYWPRNKGKVEAGVKYVRNNFMQGNHFKRDFSSLEELNKKLSFWTNSVANTRTHGTTNEKPMRRWLKEKRFLHFPKNLPEYSVSSFTIRSSTKDQLVLYKTNLYSVPREFAWRKLFIRETHQQGIGKVEIYFQNKLIAQHDLCLDRKKIRENPEHFLPSQNFNNTKVKYKNYPEVMVRPLSYYDNLIQKRTS